MAPTAPIGGVVNDEDGRPVAGAKVSPGIFFNSNDPPPGREEFRLADSYPTDTAAAGLARACRPDTTRLDLRFGSITLISSPSGIYRWQLFRAVGPRAPSFSSVGSLSRAGWSITTVIRFVERASSGSRTVGIGLRGADTDHDGRFRLEHLPAGESALTAQAKGHGPDWSSSIASRTGSC